MRYLLLATLAFLIGFQAVPSRAAEAETTYQRVQRTGTIRCGYAMWTPVLFQADLKAGTGQLTGIAYDLTEEIGRRLGLKVEWTEEAGWGTIVEGLHLHRYDMICVGIGASSARAQFIGFSAPMFYSPMYVVGRADDTRFDADYGILNDPKFRIAVMDGEMSAIVARQAFPQATVNAMPQTSDYAMLLKEVETGKSDITFITPETFADYDRNNPGKLKIVAPTRPLTTLPVSFGLPPDDFAFRQMIDVAIGEAINDGTVERLLKKIS